MSHEIELIARGVCVKDKRLLVCRNRKRGNVYLPGGHIEWGESAPESLAREIREEMGLGCRVGRFLGACEHTFIHKRKRTCEINLVFEMTLEGIDANRQPPSVEDKIEFDWLALADLKESTLEPRSLRPVIETWLRSRGGPERWASAWSPDASAT